MQPLNFSAYTIRLKESAGRISVFCEIRKRFLLLTPEEWVRQHVVHYLLEEKKYPRSLVNVEKLLKINGLSKRYDVVVFTPEGKIAILVECKAPHIKITQDVFDQIARYNLSLDAQLLMVTNGLNHYFCRMDYGAERYEFLHDLPEYTSHSTINKHNY